MVRVVRVLLEYGTNIGAEDIQARTPFQMASAMREDEIIDLLAEHGARGVL